MRNHSGFGKVNSVRSNAMRSLVPIPYLIQIAWDVGTSRAEFENPLLAWGDSRSEFSNSARRSPERLGTRLCHHAD
jgi:hypothetical protein